MVIARGLCKSYGKTIYLNKISIHVKKGGALAVAGENGAGKTTLLKILATASVPDSGALSIDGVDAIENPAGARKRIGYVPQGIALMQELSVKDNLQYWMKTKDTHIYKETLDIIGLADSQGKRVAKLSGGMKRRLNIGASFILRPDLLILDEPLAGVDIANRRRIIAHLAAMKRAGVTIIFTSHYIEEMHMLADALLALKNGTVAYYGNLEFSNSGQTLSLSDAIKYYTCHKGGETNG